MLYAIDDNKRTYSLNYAINIVKNLLLKFFTYKNIKTVEAYGLKTNTYLIGVCYTAMMNSKTLEEGLKANEKDDVITECLIHPKKYTNSKSDHHTDEFNLSTDKILQDTIYRLGYEISNHKNL